MKRTYNLGYSIQQSYHVESRADKVLRRQGKAKGVHHTNQTIIR